MIIIETDFFSIFGVMAEFCLVDEIIFGSDYYISERAEEAY